MGQVYRNGRRARHQRRRPSICPCAYRNGANTKTETRQVCRTVVYASFRIYLSYRDVEGPPGGHSNRCRGSELLKEDANTLSAAAERANAPQSASRAVPIKKVHAAQTIECEDSIAVEEPLELQLEYGPRDARITRSISVTMRTPGHDQELVAGFMLTEGILTDAADIENIALVHGYGGQDAHSSRNTLRVALVPSVSVNLASLERNFYTTSSCGICGKASLLALRSVCPPRARNYLSVDAEVLYTLPAKLRAGQTVFQRTGGLHACGLFDRDGNLLGLREDVGRHNACDKLIGREFLADRTPLRDRILLLSGRASFELLQKSVMAGIPMVISVGAPSSLAIEVARNFDVTLAGFLRDRSFNVYHGAERMRMCPQERLRDEIAIG